MSREWTEKKHNQTSEIVRKSTLQGFSDRAKKHICSDAGVQTRLSWFKTVLHRNFCVLSLQVRLFRRLLLVHEPYISFFYKKHILFTQPWRTAARAVEQQVHGDIYLDPCSQGLHECSRCTQRLRRSWLLSLGQKNSCASTASKENIGSAMTGELDFQRLHLLACLSNVRMCSIQ